MEVHIANKNKNLKDYNKITGNQPVNYKKNKTLIDNTYDNEETNYRTYNEITKIDNSSNQLKTSLINFSNSNVYNIIKESESFLNEIKPIIIKNSSI